MIAFHESLSTSDGQAHCSSISGLSIPLQTLLNHHCTIYSLAVHGPNVLLKLSLLPLTHFILEQKKMSTDGLTGSWNPCKKRTYYTKL